MTAATGASSEIGYQIGIFQVICLCRRKKKYQLEERVVGQEGEGEQGEVEEEVYKTKRSVVVRHAQPAHSHAQNPTAIEIRDQSTELDDERVKVDTFKQNVLKTETHVTTQRNDVSDAGDSLLPLLLLLVHFNMMVRSLTSCLMSCFDGLKEITHIADGFR